MKKLLFIIGLGFCLNTISQTNLWQWGHIAGSSLYYDLGSAIATTKKGDSYITGKCGSTSMFGSYTVTNTAPSYVDNVFLAKYDRFGNCLWVKRPLGSNTLDPYNSWGAGVDIDQNDNAYITGVFSGRVIFGPDTLIGYGVFLAKYDSNGNALWAIHDTLAYAIASDIKDIAVDALGNSYITVYDYIAKYNSSGHLVYRTQLTLGSGFLNMQDIDVDNLGNAFIVGNMSGPITIGGQSYSTVGSTDAIIVKLDANGNFQWLNQYNRASIGYWDVPEVFAEGVSIDKNNNVYLTGRFNDSIHFGAITLSTTASTVNNSNEFMFVTKLTNNGSVVWAKNNLSGFVESYAIINDIDCNTYITGYCNNSGYPVIFENNVSCQPINISPFIAKYDTSGNCLFAETPIGNTGAGRAYGVGVDTLCSVYITGVQLLPLTFPNGANPSYAAGTSGPLDDILIAKSYVGLNTACSLVSSINVNSLENYFNIFPNPTNGHLSINLPEKNAQANLKIYNLLGELQKNETVNGSTTTDVSTFVNGVYIIEIKDANNKISRQKFIKE